VEGALIGEEGTFADFIGANTSVLVRVGAEVLVKVDLTGEGGGIFSSFGDSGAFRPRVDGTLG